MEKQEKKDICKSSYVPVRLAHNIFEPLSGGDEVPRPPFIFLHGITSCKETWMSIPQVVSDATKRNVYTFDTRNHGDSDWSESFTMDDLIQDALRFMDSIDATKAILIGHSLGGKVAINLALRKPDRVELLVVEDMFVKDPPESLVHLSLAYTVLAPRALFLVPNDVDETTAADIIANYVSSAIQSEKPGRQKSTRFDRSTVAVKKMPDGRFALKANMPVLEESLRKAAECVDQEQGVYGGPTCFIYGKMSPFNVPNDAENIRRYFPKALFVGIENSSHSVHLDNPEDFIEKLLDFVTKNLDTGEEQGKDSAGKKACISV